MAASQGVGVYQDDRIVSLRLKSIIHIVVMSIRLQFKSKEHRAKGKIVEERSMTLPGMSQNNSSFVKGHPPRFLLVIKGFVESSESVTKG